MTRVVAQFEVLYYQLLDEKGDIHEPLPAFAHDTEILKELYQIMLRTRLFDKKAISLQRTGKMGTYAPINGQEAISTAIGHSLKPEDLFVPYYRDYAAQFQRGVKMSDILTYWGGDERGSQYSPNNQDLPICVPIASQCLHAAGAAFAFQYRQEKRVALVCVGEGGTSEGDFYEAMNVAGVWNLPIVFVINNNHWAISVESTQQTASQTFAQKAIAAGFNGLQVDGNDVIALKQVIEESIEKARRGEGPTLIEALTYRLCDHTTADDATRYQPHIQVTEATTIEPINRLRQYLTAKHIWDNEQEKAFVESCHQEIDAAVSEYLSQPPQELGSIFDYHYAELPQYLKEQRSNALKELTNA